MRVSAAILVAIVLLAIAATANGKTSVNSVSWATWEQRAQKEIKAGGIYSTRHASASPKLKYIVIQMIYMRFGHGYVGYHMYRCALRESGFNPGAISRTNDHGTFQINYAAHHDSFDFWKIDHSPGYGINAAWRLYQGAGFGPWYGPC